tara:strand:+ start:7308 stop:7862 length:555 start_codon:yes stop_codon:yes gene_type:complete
MKSIQIPPGIKEVFNELGRGHRQFISDNGDEDERKLYDRIERHLDDYNLYLEALGFKIHEGDGFYYLTGPEDNASQNTKLDRQLNWILSLGLLTEALDTFEDGQSFRAADIEAQCGQNADMAERLRKHSQCGANASLSDQTDSILKGFERVGFILRRSTHDRSYTILSSINYLRDIIVSLNIQE